MLSGPCPNVSDTDWEWTCTDDTCTCDWAGNIDCTWTLDPASYSDAESAASDICTASNSSTDPILECELDCEEFIDKDGAVSTNCSNQPSFSGPGSIADSQCDSSMEPV